MQSAAKIRADFDRLALLDAQDKWNHNSHYHPYLLNRLPPNCEETLEIGCGTGALARLLAEKSRRVTAIDLSPEMIRVARQRSGAYGNIDFEVADILDWNWPSERFDCIVSVATLHHLPMDEMLLRMRGALKPGGKLLVLDLMRAESPGDKFVAALGMPVHVALKLRHTGTLRETPEVRQAWNEHGKTDSYLTLREIYELCEHWLPGAVLKRHLLWRYSIVWEKRKV